MYILKPRSHCPGSPRCVPVKRAGKPDKPQNSPPPPPPPRKKKSIGSFLFKRDVLLITGVIQLIPPVLSSETLLHILLSSEYSGFRPSTTAVVTITAPVSVSTVPKFRRYSAQLSRKIIKKVFIVISNVFPTFLTYR